jgi:putative ABC transport system permease protein
LIAKDELARCTLITQNVGLKTFKFSRPLNVIHLKKVFMNFLNFFLRLSKRNSAYALVNLVGLVMGFVVSIVVLSFVIEEFTYDQFHDQEEHVYRIVRSVGEGNAKYYNDRTRVSVLPGGLGPEVKLQSDAVEDFFRITAHEANAKLPQRDAIKLKLLATDPSFFDMLTWNWLNGHVDNFRNDRQGAVLTKSFALRLFGSANALGKSMVVLTQNGEYELTVQGIIEDFPLNSHIKGDAVVQIEPFINVYFPGDLGDWGNSNYFTYVKLQPQAAVSDVENRLNDIFTRNRPQLGTSNYLHHSLQPFQEIHFDTDVAFGLEPAVSIQKHYIMLAIALVVLLLACSNYINLAIAQCIKRAKEIGIRKASGAQSGNIVAQFFGETLITCSVSFALAFLLSWMLLPYFNYLIGIALSLSSLIESLPYLVVVLMATICAAGVYPALILSRYKPSKVLKLKITQPEVGGFAVRDILIVFQFSVSIILIITIVVYQSQLDYLLEQDPGFNREQIIVVSMNDQEWQKKTESLRQRIKQQANVAHVSFSNGLPHHVRTQQGRNWTIAGEDVSVSFYTLYADEEFTNLYGLQVLEGKGVLTTGSIQEFLLNETAVREYGWKDPVGMEFKQGNDTIRIVGIVKDFHLQSKHQPIKPLRIGNLKDGWITHMSVSFTGGDPKQLIAAIETALKEVSNKTQVDYSFFDETYGKVYEADRRSGEAMKFFTVVSFIIAALGLYGLVMFAVNSRTKEIGIRKVLGAGWPSISWLVTRHFAKLLGVSFLLAIYPAYYLSHQWLAGFAYRIEFMATHVLVAVGLLLVTIVFTVGNKLWSATKINPAEVLRRE